MPNQLPETTMHFTFKLAKTSIVKTFSISSKKLLEDLLEMAANYFKQFIDFQQYSFDYVLVGQPGDDNSSYIDENKDEYQLDDIFSIYWEKYSFYVIVINDTTYERCNNIPILYNPAITHMNQIRV